MVNLVRKTIFIHPDNILSMKELREDLKKQRDRRGLISEAEFIREVFFEGLTAIALDLDEAERVQNEYS
jgi:hypothetical protein